MCGFAGEHVLPLEDGLGVCWIRVDLVWKTRASKRRGPMQVDHEGLLNQVEMYTWLCVGKKRMAIRLEWVKRGCVPKPRRKHYH